jgi:diacylglycerol kinase family enzyme
VLGRTVQGRAGESPFVQVTRGERFRIRFNRPMPCELDGGARGTVKELRIKVHPGSIKLCLPAQA